MSAGLMPAIRKLANAVGGQSTMICRSIARNEWSRPEGKKALPLPSNSTRTMEVGGTSGLRHHRTNIHLSGQGGRCYLVFNMANWSAKNPYMSKITECYILNGEGSKKETRHIVFDLGDSGLDYKVGDALGVFGENPESTVDLLIETAGWDKDQLVTTQNGKKRLRDALKKDVEIHRVNKKYVN